MANNKVQLADGTVLMDVTDTTALASTVKSGDIFYNAAGIRQTGTLIVDETYSIQQNLTNVTSSVDDTKVIAGNCFYTKLTPSEGYNILSVIVTMNGVDITREVFKPGVGEKTITANGTYNASEDSLSGYERVVVNVPTGIIPTGTKQISIATNGTTIEDVTSYANAEIVVNVPSGGYTLEQVLSGEALTGSITYLGESIRSCSFGNTDIVEFHAPNLTTIKVGIYNNQSSNSNLFYGCTKLTTIDCPELIMQRDTFAYSNPALTTVNLPKCTYIGASGFSYCTSLENIVLPSVTTVYTSAFASCTKLEGADFGASITSGSISGLFRNNIFNGCTKFNKLVLRTSHAIYPLTNINVFNNTPFASGKAGGTLYVPQTLIATYQAASNWSTILGYTNNQIKSIESTATDPNAPVDLTTHYIDGTLIPIA